MSLPVTAMDVSAAEAPSAEPLHVPDEAPRTQRTFRRTAWLGLIPPVLLLVGLECAVRAGWIPNHLLPAPSDLWLTVQQLGWTTLSQHVGISTLRVFTGFLLGSSLALVIGAAVGLWKPLEDLLDPSFQALRAIPSLAWVPLLLLWLGIDEAPKLTLIAIGAFFPVYLGVSAGLRGVGVNAYRTPAAPA